MSKRIYVGNVPFGATEEEIKAVFSPYGEVKSIDIVKDRATGRPRGFCFIDMENADDAIVKVAGTELGGRKLYVNEARERGQGGPRNDQRHNNNYPPRGFDNRGFNNRGFDNRGGSRREFRRDRGNGY